jgi:AcrR family transcriptional regulator
MPRARTISDESILEAARERFLADGFGASTTAIAKRAGISEALIFRRFGTKDELFARALGLGDAPAFAARAEELVGAGDPRRNLVELSLAIIDYYETNLPRLLMVWSSRTRAPVGQTLQEPPPLRNLKVITRYLEREMRLGRIRSCEPEIVARALLGALSNHVLYRLFGVHARRPMSAQRYAESLVSVLWEGIAAEGKSERARRVPRGEVVR